MHAIGIMARAVEEAKREASLESMSSEERTVYIKTETLWKKVTICFTFAFVAIMLTIAIVADRVSRTYSHATVETVVAEKDVVVHGRNITWWYGTKLRINGQTCQGLPVTIKDAEYDCWEAHDVSEVEWKKINIGDVLKVVEFK